MTDIYLRLFVVDVVDNICNLFYFLGCFILVSFCYVMVYCEGGTLHSLMSRLQRFHEDLARFLAAEIILAVNFLHKCSTIHKDIKPGNILLDRDGHCKLADFGLSQD